MQLTRFFVSLKELLVNLFTRQLKEPTCQLVNSSTCQLKEPTRQLNTTNLLTRQLKEPTCQLKI